MSQHHGTGPFEPAKEQVSGANASRQVAMDVRSRDAFELLKLGEAIVKLQSDMRNLRLEKEDLRFERDRYQASAAQFQTKMASAFDELDKLRPYREESGRLRSEVVALAQEFTKRLELELSVIAEQNQRSEQARNDAMAAQVASHNERLEREIAAVRAELNDAHELRLRHEIVLLTLESKVKLDNLTETMRRDMVPTPRLRERWRLT